jgi:nitrogen fixation NifU-like protein
MYSPQLLDHFQNPRNAGVIEAPDSSVEVRNPVCGDILRLTLKVAEGRIADIRFQAKGCVPAMACASAMTELAKGKNLQEARNIEQKDLMDAVGSLPSASTHAIHLALDALRQTLRSLSPHAL